MGNHVAVLLGIHKTPTYPHNYICILQIKIQRVVVVCVVVIVVGERGAGGSNICIKWIFMLQRRHDDERKGQKEFIKTARAESWMEPVCGSERAVLHRTDSNVCWCWSRLKIGWMHSRSHNAASGVALSPRAKSHLAPPLLNRLRVCGALFAPAPASCLFIRRTSSRALFMRREMRKIASPSNAPDVYRRLSA